MKSIIDCSVHLIILTLICFISLDFILANIDINRKQEAVCYMENYIELYGESETGDMGYDLADGVKDAVRDIACDNGIDINISYKESSTRYHYYDMICEYSLNMQLMNINKLVRRHSIVRTERNEL